MSSAPDDHRTMIGLPATYRPGQQRAQPPPEEEYNAYMAQMRASGIPSSTMPSAAHSARSLEQHPNAQTLNNENPHFGVFEPQIAPRSYSSFAPLLGSDQAQGQNGQQQVPGEFVPGGGGGIYRRNTGARPHPQVLTQSIHDVSRSNTTMSGYSDPSSSANMSSPVRPSASGYAHQQPYASPPDFGPAGFSFPNTGRSLEYPSSGSDPFPGSEQYTSPSPANYMSSPEMIQPGHFGHQQQQQQQTRPMTNIFNATSPPYTSPTRPGPAPYIGSGDQAWQPTTGLAPSSSLVPISGNGSSGGSHSSGGGGGTGGGAYAGSSGGYSTGSNPAAQQRPTVGLSGGPGRSRSVGGGNATRYRHTHSQSGDGLLAPPRPNKRQHIAAEEDEESSEEDARQGARGGQQNATKRL